MVRESRKQGGRFQTQKTTGIPTLENGLKITREQKLHHFTTEYSKCQMEMIIITVTKSKHQRVRIRLKYEVVFKVVLQQESSQGPVGQIPFGQI